MRYIEGIDRKRKISFPECIDDYITEDNSMRVIEAFVDSLNIVELGFKNASPTNLGRLGFDPRVLLKLYVYVYMNKINSSRKLETEATRNIELMWLLRKLKPDHKVISDFRKDNKEALKMVFKEFVHCADSGICLGWK